MTIQSERCQVPRLTHALIAAMLLVTSVAWLAPEHAAVSAQRGGSAETKRYIVVLKSSAADAVVAAGELEAETGTPIEPEMVYKHALNGFVAEMPPQAAAALENDPDVLFVEERTRSSTPTHRRCRAASTASTASGIRSHGLARATPSASTLPCSIRASARTRI